MIDDSARYRDLRILVVEDESFARRIITGLLRQIGFTLIEEAIDGEKGFREVIRTRPQLVLCDVHMEPVDGLGFLSQLREFAGVEIAATPVIFLTADKQQETVISAKQLKVDGYLVKPVSLAALKQRLDAVLKFHNLI
ncbi:MAG: response regulator [Ferrovibrio sp.]|uniref:response regulator n=1 Tax=Ferrovibrio sp. TaxID=1917215 RepID=UPI00261394DA|nr:response regulator [Ferrovibrio sp.]MCW0235484.1 response regulator [Ferrovibrio sp.]